MPAPAPDQTSIDAIAFALRVLAHDAAAELPPCVTRFLSGCPQLDHGNVSGKEFAHRVQYAVRRLRAAARSPERVRALTILEQCDVDGRTHKAVSRDLGLSRSQFYRDLRAARLAVAQDVARTPATAAPVFAQAPSFDPISLALRHARGREQNGDWAGAAAALEHLAANIPDSESRVDIELRLARLHGDAQNFAAARRQLNVARAIVAREAPVAAWRMAEIDVARGRFAEATGNSDAAGPLARRGAAILAHTLGEVNTERIRDALVDAFTLRAEVCLGRGELDEARRAAGQATDVARDSGAVDPQRVIAAQSVAAMTDLVAGGDPERIQRELEAAYELAVRYGFTREAIVVATHMAGYLRLMQRSDAEVALLTPLLPTARVVGSGGVLAAFLSELLAANVERGTHAEAGPYIYELRECARGNGHMEAVADFTAAKVHLAAREYGAALSAARDASARFARIGKPRPVGSILLLESNALVGLGLRGRAQDSLRAAIEHLAGRTHPARLAAAHTLLGRLSGRAEHFSIARKLLRTGAHPDSVSRAAGGAESSRRRVRPKPQV